MSEKPLSRESKDWGAIFLDPSIAYTVAVLGLDKAGYPWLLLLSIAALPVSLWPLGLEHRFARGCTARKRKPKSREHSGSSRQGFECYDGTLLVRTLADGSSWNGQMLFSSPPGLEPDLGDFAPTGPTEVRAVTAKALEEKLKGLGPQASREAILEAAGSGGFGRGVKETSTPRLNMESLSNLSQKKQIQLESVKAQPIQITREVRRLKVACVSVPEAGHLVPTVEVAKALAQRGHETVLLTLEGRTARRPSSPRAVRRRAAAS
ncbi:unnamed protein product [Effrenium voratum]|nr:unnamed protein product [Effrenium voratum]